MRTFRCRCGNRIYFGNSKCLRCGAVLGFLPDRLQLAALEPLEDDWLVAGRRYRQCLHYSRDRVCNWMVPAEDEEPFCAACRLNEVIPDLGNPQFRLYWTKLEAAKRYLLYGLGRLGLSLRDLGREADGLRFAFLADYGADQRVVTGHRNGLITINVREADDAYRETMRLRLREPYRTLLGHFRHESGHYFWQRLIDGQPRLEAFRRCFGDERQDYQAALSRHYAAPAAAGSDYISGYAAAHPWEDWAETWAHYLLIRDTAETAGDYGLIEPFDLSDIDALLGAWVNLSLGINGLGESLGIVTPYPFVISARVEEKLRFVDEVIREARARPREGKR